MPPTMTQKEADERAAKALQTANEDPRGSWEHERVSEAILDAVAHEREDAASYLDRCATILLTSKTKTEMQEVMNVEIAKLLATCAKKIREGSEENARSS